MLFVDLDGFKDVNDTLGYSAGDLLLQWVADRLRLSLRPMDVLVRGDITGESKTELARLGGDEFTILASQLKQTENVLSLARRVQELMQRPFQLEGREVVLTASIGIAMYPEDGTDAATLLKNADTAMFNAKHHGRSNYQFYSASLTLQAAKRLDLESNLRLALERDEFFLVYQPQFSIANNQIESVEALIRWKHPDKGFISPLEFIPTAEENGLIVPIGDWVLRTACENAAKWIAQGKPLKVAINLSALQFREPGLIKRIQHILEEYKLPPKWLELEVTEGALMEDSEVTLNSLHALRRLDIQIALDDFGTGYSSLSYLKKLPLNTLKIDQSFVRGLPADRESLAIVKTILSLAQNLGYETTAEGIETMEQAYLLKNMGCDVLQGHYFSKAVLAEEIPKLLSRQWVINEFASEDELDLDIE